MSDITSKQMSEKDGMQVLRQSFNDNDATISTSGFLDGKVGHRIKTEAITANMDENSYFDEITVKTCTLTLGSAIVIVPNTIDLELNQFVLLDVGTSGIPDNTKILSIDSNTQITLTAAATAATGPYTVHFANLLKRIRILYNNSTHDILLDAARVE